MIIQLSDEYNRVGPIETVSEALSKFIITFKGKVHSLMIDHDTEFSGLDILKLSMALELTIAMPIVQSAVAAMMNTLTEFCVIFTLRERILST